VFSVRLRNRPAAAAEYRPKSTSAAAVPFGQKIALPSPPLQHLPPPGEHHGVDDARGQTPADAAFFHKTRFLSCSCPQGSCTSVFALKLGLGGPRSSPPTPARRRVAVYTAHDSESERGSATTPRICRRLNSNLHITSASPQILIPPRRFVLAQTTRCRNDTAQDGFAGGRWMQRNYRADNQQRAQSEKIQRMHVARNAISSRTIATTYAHFTTPSCHRAGSSPPRPSG
jgi:hypothetical protein